MWIQETVASSVFHGQEAARLLLLLLVVEIPFLNQLLFDFISVELALCLDQRV